MADFRLGSPAHITGPLLPLLRTICCLTLSADTHESHQCGCSSQHRPPGGAPLQTTSFLPSTKGALILCLRAANWEVPEQHQLQLVFVGRRLTAKSEWCSGMDAWRHFHLLGTWLLMFLFSLELVCFCVLIWSPCAFV